MSDYCKETQCSNCAHILVCSMKDKFLDAQRAVDTLEVHIHTPGAAVEIVKLHDIGFIQPVELKCIHYLPKKTTLIR